MALLRCDYYWANLNDAIYRLPTIYNSREALFGMPAPDDPLNGVVRTLLTTLRAESPGAALIGPLGVGGHVDHQVTHTALLAAAPQAQLYEDIPYVLRPGALEQRLAEVGRQLAGAVRPAGSAELATKLAAIGAYQSQLGALFGGEVPMRASIAEYTAAIGGERVWVVR